MSQLFFEQIPHFIIVYVIILVNILKGINVNGRYKKVSWKYGKCFTKSSGYFVGNFFGFNDSWSKIKEQMVFLTKEQVLDLFRNSFE